MKNNFLILLLLTLFTDAAFAQDLLSKIPSGATLVVKYSGGNLSQKMPAEKFESYKLLKRKFFDAFKTDANTSLQNIGINLQQDAYQYVATTDSTTSFVTMLSINNPEKFNQFIKSKNKDTIPIQSKKGFQFYPISANSFLGWDSKLASLVITSYNSNNIYQPPVINDTTVTYGSVGQINPYADASISLEKVMAAADSTAAMAAMDSAIIITDTTAATIEDADNTEPAHEETEQEKANREVMDRFYKDEALKKDSIQKMNAENVLLDIYNSPVTSIKGNASFTKLVDKNADISIWMDSTGLLNRMPYYLSKYKYNFNALPGYPQGVNVFFEKDKVKIEQQVMYGNAQSARLFKNVYSSKQNPAFVNYLRASDIGFASVSVNSEALMTFYYDFMKKALAGMPFIGKEAELIDAYVDIMEIIIDEKGIADMLPGNAMFILHGLKPRQVEYIDYTYDDNFKGKQTTKTKTEMSPDFSIFFETKNENIFNKLINLPVKLNRDNKYDYKKTGAYYTLVLGEKNIIDKVYFMVKDGKCVITTSLQDVTGAAQNEKNVVDAATKQAVLNSNYAGNIHFKNLISALSAELTDKKNKKMISYLQANVNTFTFESAINDDMIKTTALLNIAGKHKNSLEYFFNVIENLLNIDAGDKK